MVKIRLNLVGKLSIHSLSSICQCSSSSLSIRAWKPLAAACACNSQPLVKNLSEKLCRFHFCFGNRNYYSTMPAPVAKNGAATARRLPQNVIPANYDLTVEPDWTNHSFVATALIDIIVKEPTDVVVLNVSKLEIKSPITYTPEDGAPQETETFSLDVEQETLRINFPSGLKPGSGHLKISYSGVVADNLRGFFRSKYQGPGGEERFNYLTKFEPTYARCCYPSWDEPNIKATYDITLIVPKHLTALSNMPVKEDTPHPENVDKKIVKFEQSVKMSTYVMAFAIGEFDYVERSTPEGILCRVYTPVGKKERGNFALETVVKALAYYKNYFGIPYPLPKMDLLAVAEFGSGAMENWGLVVFIEHRLLMDEKLSSSLAKQYVALVVCHETAHMWFGNLVTMEWWNDLWLNEGFAKWMEYKCTDVIYPEFKIWNLFMNVFREALDLDASSFSHPIQVCVEDPGQIGSIFDTISYNKGASVIRMLNNFLGDETFREGLKRYLTQNVYGNAETKDLCSALSEKSGQEIDAVMSSFTEQMGFPILTVTSIEQESESKKKITLSYEKFWADAKSKESNSTNYKWTIPVTVRKQSDVSGIALKSLVDKAPGEEFTLLVDAKEGEWVKLNADQIGFYRVVYPSSVIEDFIPAIKNKEMSSLDRLGILDDLFAHAKAGNACSADVLKLLLAYKNEDDAAVWVGVLDIISTMHTLLRGTALYENFKIFSQTLLGPIASKLGWTVKENEEQQDSILRALLLRTLIDLENPSTIEEGRNLFAKHVRGDISLSSDIRGAAYRSVAQSDGESGYEALMKVYRSADLKEEKLRIISAMGATKDKNVIEKYLEFGRSDEVVKQDIVYILHSLSEMGNQDVCWNYFQNHWEFFRESFPTGHFLIRMIIEDVTAGFKSEEKALEIEKFFKDHELKGVQRTVEQSLESIRNAKSWLERDASGLQEFLGAYTA